MYYKESVLYPYIVARKWIHNESFDQMIIYILCNNSILIVGLRVVAHHA